MNYKELREATEKAMDKLYDILTDEEKICLNGMGVALDDKTRKPYLSLRFTDSNPKSSEFAKRWNNQKILDVEVRAEIRPIPTAQ